eukprot:TRINITY_DN2076_c0_g1_i15.p1 TRINITY_DN2076_c0_g1~~TRINITY_DN2076_c0_g1_i15.p1  ORF type:complete len:103 (+),score=8.57 TRINITY_DN2076_c0_g1_i15:379-687(+)
MKTKVDKNIDIILLSMEFESLCLLCPPNAPQVLVQVENLQLKPSKKAELLSQLATVAFNSGMHNRKLSIQLLQQSKALYLSESQFPQACEGQKTNQDSPFSC